MSSKAPQSNTSPPGLLAWALLSLPLVLVTLGCLALYGGEAQVAAHFAQWRAEHQTAALLLSFYTNYGNAAFYLVYLGIFIQALRQRDTKGLSLALGYLAAQLAVSFLAVRILKMSIGRPRPLVGGPWVPFTADPGHHSMPSGHSVDFTVQTLPLALRARSLFLPVLLGLALGLMAFSRLALGWHHPSDVLCGWAMGTLGGLLAQAVAARLHTRFSNRPLTGWKP